MRVPDAAVLQIKVKPVDPASWSLPLHGEGGGGAILPWRSPPPFQCSGAFTVVQAQDSQDAGASSSLISVAHLFIVFGVWKKQAQTVLRNIIVFSLLYKGDQVERFEQKNTGRVKNLVTLSFLREK